MNAWRSYSLSVSRRKRESKKPSTCPHCGKEIDEAIGVSAQWILAPKAPKVRVNVQALRHKCIKGKKKKRITSREKLCKALYASTEKRSSTTNKQKKLLRIRIMYNATVTL
jgi:hypothetical protein